MISSHLTNGLIKSDHPETTKKEAIKIAQNYRSKGVNAYIFQNTTTKKRSVWIPENS